MKFAVVIPTRNREELLLQLLENLSSCVNVENLQILVIDSSDEEVKFSANYPFQFHYVHTKIKSAAAQRNIGLMKINQKSFGVVDLVAFLDDDIRIERDYFQRIQTGFYRLPDAVGISGVTDNIGRPKSGLIRKVFGFYEEPGKITKGGVNVPVDFESIDNSHIETNWLIGCSAWRYESIRDQRFQEDFEGQSLFEDVIFSYQLSKIGKLFVLASVRLTHLQSSIGRPDTFRHNLAWVKNRYRLFELFEDDFRKRNFWIANFGKFLYEFLSFLRRPSSLKIRSVVGLLAGSIRVVIR